MIIITIKDSLYFVYDGISSQDMGIINVNIDSGLQSEPFYPSASILEISTRYNETPYFQKIKREPLVFNLTFAFEDGFDDDKLRETARWLNQKTFKELYFSNQPDKKYFAIYEGSPRLFHTGADGYFEITFRTNSPYAHSNLIETGIYNQVSPTFTFTRPSPAIHPETGAEVDADTPVFVDFAGGRKGSLMCEGTENLIPPGRFDFATWLKGAGIASVSATEDTYWDYPVYQVVAKADGDPGSTFVRLSYSSIPLTIAIDEQYTATFYVKKLNHRFVGFRVFNAWEMGKTHAVLNLDTGEVQANISVLKIKATIVGGGWWRVTVTNMGLTLTSGYVGICLPDDMDGAEKPPCNGQGVYWAGLLQLEKKPYDTPFQIGTRANPATLLTLPEALPAEFGIGISAKMLHAHGIKSRTFWQAGDYHRLFYDMADSKIKMQYGGAIAETSPVSWSADDIIGVYGGKKDGKLFVQAKVAGELGEKTAVEVGGRNLLRNSKGPWTNSSYRINFFPFGDAIPAAGEIYTITMKYTVGADRTQLAVHSSGGYRNLVSFYETDKNELGIASKTFTMRYTDGKTPAEGFDYLSVYQLPLGGTSESTIEWIKLERGNKPTDWTPAPEDEDSKDIYIGSNSDNEEHVNAVLADFVLHDRPEDIDPIGYLSAVPGGGST